MNYVTILTSKGTTTVPVEIRRQLGLKPGMQLAFSQNKTTGEFVLKRAQTIQDIRALNKAALAQAGSSRQYYSGAGFEEAVGEELKIPA